jgi:hypothetical protein
MSSFLPPERHRSLSLSGQRPALLAADLRVVTQIRRGGRVVEMSKQREGNVSRQEWVGQRIAAFVLERGTNERLAPVARECAE